MYWNVASNCEYSSILDTIFHSWRYFQGNTEAATLCVRGGQASDSLHWNSIFVHLIASYYGLRNFIVSHWFTNLESHRTIHSLRTSRLPYFKIPLDHRSTRSSPLLELLIENSISTLTKDRKMYNALLCTASNFNDNNKDTSTCPKLLNKDGSKIGIDVLHTNMERTEALVMCEMKPQVNSNARSHMEIASMIMAKQCVSILMQRSSFARKFQFLNRSIPTCSNSQSMLFPEIFVLKFSSVLLRFFKEFRAWFSVRCSSSPKNVAVRSKNSNYLT